MCVCVCVREREREREEEEGGFKKLEPKYKKKKNQMHHVGLHAVDLKTKPEELFALFR